MGLDMYLYKGDRKEKNVYIEINEKTKIGYWRKANAIHNWIYKNCARSGQYDCEVIEVSLEKINELYKLCKSLIKYRPKRQNDKVSKDAMAILERELHTCNGCFFGSVDYDDIYFSHIENTINICEIAMVNVDFSKEKLLYYGSY